ncbi:MAG: hypothetical protein WA214_24445 [Pseudolabrys sp.]
MCTGKAARLPRAQVLATFSRPRVSLGHDSQVGRNIQVFCQALNDLFRAIHSHFSGAKLGSNAESGEAERAKQL